MREGGGAYLRDATVYRNDFLVIRKDIVGGVYEPHASELNRWFYTYVDSLR